MGSWRVIGCCSLLLIAADAAPVSAQRIRLPENLRTLEQRARADSNDPAAHFNVALAYWNDERWDDARRSLEQAVAIDSRFAAAWLALAMLPFGERRRLWREIDENRVPVEWAGALETSDRHYRRALLIDPLVDFRIVGAAVPGRDAAWLSSPQLEQIYDFLFRGFDDFRQGDYRNAHSRFQEYLREIDADRFPNRAPNVILYLRGLAAGHIEMWDAAIADFQLLFERHLAEERRDELLRIPLATNELRYVLAVMHERSGALDEAIRLYQEALGEDVGLYMANVQLAVIHEARGDMPAALRERQAAINANPDDPSLVYDLALTEIRAGQWAQAARTLRQAAEANPRDARIPYYRGLAALRLRAAVGV